MARGAGAKLGFPGANPWRDRHGRIRWRLRKTGYPTIYLPGLPGSPEFAEAYEAALSGARIQPGARRTVPGTINALAVAAYESAEWRGLAETTQRNYRGVMERLRKDYGGLRVTGLSPAVVLKLRDKLDGKAAQNNFIKALRWFMTFAVSRAMRRDDPTAGIKKIKYATEGYHTWTEAEVAAFEKTWPVGTKQRLGLDLLLYTGQRSKDVRTMGRQHINGAFIRVRQSKTATELEIPIHPRLAASLATVPPGQMLFLPTQSGVPYTEKGFYNWMKAAYLKAGVPECSPHGGRKCIATRLADAGCSHAQIMSVTGHKNPKEVETYIRARDQRRLAQAAMSMIDTDVEQKLDNQSNRLSK